MIDPSGIPHFIGDLDTLDTDVMLLTADAGQLRASGSDIHTTFQHLSAFYSAPEAEQLFSTTLPVQQKSDAFAGDLEKVANALSDYSLEVQPLVKRLDSLKAEATAFVNSVTGDDHWRKDQNKLHHNNDLWHDVNHTVTAFQAAERRAYNKIMALIGGHALTVDDGSHGEHMYGYKAADLDHAQETPWGAPAEREYEGWRWLAHQGKQVWDGIWTDGVMGAVHGLGTLVGWDGWDAAGEAWKNLGKVGIASALTTETLGAWWLVPDKDLPSWLRDSRTAYKQTVKGFVAYDEWKTNPGRAAGAVIFNAVTVLGTEGAGSAASGAGRAGAAARVVSAAGKVGRVIDPMTYVGKAGAFAFTKVGDTFSALKGLRTGATADLFKQADAFRSPKIPDTAIPYLDSTTGKVVFLTDEGHILNADGSLRQHVGEAAHELSTNERAALNTTAHTARLHDPVGAGTRAEHTTGSAHPSEQTPEQAGRGDSGHMASREGSSNRTADAESPDRPGSSGGSGTHGTSGTGPGDGAHGSGHDHGSGDHDATATHGTHESPREDSGHSSSRHEHAGAMSGNASDAGRTGPGRGPWPVVDGVKGPAAGRSLRYPNPRHTVSGAAHGEIKKANSVILRGYEQQVNQDLADIAAGKGTWREKLSRYEVNGRLYEVEPSGKVFPDSGKGIVKLDRNEYAALQQVSKAKGDISTAPQLTRDPRFTNNPGIVKKALDIYNGTYTP